MFRQSTATTNSGIYDDAFLVVPTDAVRTVEECQAYEGRSVRTKVFFFFLRVCVEVYFSNDGFPTGLLNLQA